MTQNNNDRSFWIGAIVGGVVGGLTALLLAPKAGRELRQDLAEGAKQATEKTQQIAHQLGEKTTDFVGAAREKKNGMKRSFQEWRNGNPEVNEQEPIANVSSLTAEAGKVESLSENERDTNFVI